MRSDAAQWWLKGFMILVAAAVILCAEQFVTGESQYAIVIRVVMDFAAFAVVFVGLRFWMARKRSSGNRTIATLAVLLLVLLAVSFVLPGFVTRYSGWGSMLVRLASSRVAELIPAVVALGFVIYAFIWWLRGGNR